MTKRMILAIAAITAMLPGAAQAQTKYFSRVGLPKASATASSGTPAAGSKTLVCSGFQGGFLPNPEQNTQPTRIATSFADGLVACNELAAGNGELFKNFKYCRVNYQPHLGPNVYYAALVQSPQLTDINPYDPNASTQRGSGTCTYYP